MQRLLGLIPGLVMALLATALAVAVFERAHTQHDARDWPSTDGVIIKSEVLPGAGVDGRWMHALDLQYSYQAEGSTYVGERVTALGPASVWLRGGPAAIADEYEAGDSVEVFYKPGSPTNGLLEPGLDTVEMILAAAGIGLPTLFALYCVRRSVAAFAESSDREAIARDDQRRRASGVDAFNRVVPGPGQRPRTAA